MQTTPAFLLENQQYENLSIERDADGEAIFMSMDVRPRPCFTWGLVRDMLSFQRCLTEASKFSATNPRCIVYASESRGVFSLGGDLSLFQATTENKDRAMLTRYIEDCINVMHNFVSMPETVTVSLLEGEALGGGFELALSSDVIIAERGIRLGFPEVLFNLIPGLGGFYLMARRVGPRIAEKIIREGGLHTAEDLHALGLIDILVDKGEGRRAVYDLLDGQKRSWNTYRALQHVKRDYLPITRQMLLSNARIWVDAVMKLTGRDLRMMKRLVRAQGKRSDMDVAAETMENGLVQRVAA